MEKRNEKVDRRLLARLGGFFHRFPGSAEYRKKGKDVSAVVARLLFPDCFIHRGPQKRFLRFVLLFDGGKVEPVPPRCRKETLGLGSWGEIWVGLAQQSPGWDFAFCLFIRQDKPHSGKIKWHLKSPFSSC